MERSRDWLAQAVRDLEHARLDLERGFFEWCCFSAQQSAEKAAKALMQRLGCEAWGHSVADLLRALPEAHRSGNELVERGLELDKGYIPARYPDAHPAGHPGSRFTRSEAERAIGHAEAIVEFCSRQLAALDPR